MAEVSPDPLAHLGTPLVPPIILGPPGVRQVGADRLALRPPFWLLAAVWFVFAVAVVSVGWEAYTWATGGPAQFPYLLVVALAEIWFDCRVVVDRGRGGVEFAWAFGLWRRRIPLTDVKAVRLTLYRSLWTSHRVALAGAGRQVNLALIKNARSARRVAEELAAFLGVPVAEDQQA